MRLFFGAMILLLASSVLTPALADGKLVRPRDYAGSLEERAQEAIIIFQGSQSPGEAVEDLILKISVRGEASVAQGIAQSVAQFAWVVPFPQEPKVEKEDARLFKELFDYVQARAYRPKSDSRFGGAASKAAAESPKPVEVLSRKIVGSYDVAVVRENVAGALNQWLDAEGYQNLADGEDVIGFYRQKGYVFACIKVSQVELSTGTTVDLHPLRFTFKTGGRDGIYFPMKMTGLQSEPFDVNLYVFYRFWINDALSKFGYVHRGFRLNYRDWDSSECEANGGKAYSAPQLDPFLRDFAFRLPNVTALFQKLHPGERYYLTNLQAFGLRPGEVRQWADDLWLFPYYTNKRFVPYDARSGGVAAAAWLNEPGSFDDTEEPAEDRPWTWLAFIAAGSLACLLLALRQQRLQKRANGNMAAPS